MGSHKKRRRHNSDTSSSDSSDTSKRRKRNSNKKKIHLKRKSKKRHDSSSSSTSTTLSSSSSSSSTSSSSSSESEQEVRPVRKDKLKRLTKKAKGKKKMSKDKTVKSVKESASTDIPINLMEKAKAMAPMTKEQWEKQQSVVKKVYDESTGRHRLIKGDGEVLEEIVSRDRHKAINQQATRGDGDFFQARLTGLLKK